jgi:hypothetical protein
MEDNKPKTPIETLEALFLRSSNEPVSVDAVVLLMKDIIISQENRIIDLELTVDTLQRQLDRK